MWMCVRMDVRGELVWGTVCEGLASDLHLERGLKRLGVELRRGRDAKLEDAVVAARLVDDGNHRNGAQVEVLGVPATGGARSEHA